MNKSSIFRQTVQDRILALSIMRGAELLNRSLYGTGRLATR